MRAEGHFCHGQQARNVEDHRECSATNTLVIKRCNSVSYYRHEGQPEVMTGRYVLVASKR